jgi:hypothetical protein
VASFALFGALLSALAVAWPRERVTAGNFDKVRLGMSQAELYRLLGPPMYQTTELGLVRGPEDYTVGLQTAREQLLGGRFQEYFREHWHSSEIAITVISLPDGVVVCRYKGEGVAAQTWLEVCRSWLSRLLWKSRPDGPRRSTPAKQAAPSAQSWPPPTLWPP